MYIYVFIENVCVLNKYLGHVDQKNKREKEEEVKT